MESRWRPCWIKPNGKVVPCPNWGDHMNTAGEEFPESGDPEEAALRAGWFKAFRLDDAFSFSCKKVTDAQRDTITDLFRGDPDAVTDEAEAAFAFHESCDQRGGV